MSWSELAQICYADYGVYVDWDERFFECPECGEPIYECDWADSDLINGDDNYICPVCENIID